ncbi:MAG: MCE family protein [Gomphosphaeria aponina SAG 52.96 = DSM 107014]|uniref:MCE family protein n=1 Tax=Gomphosphaeria aponina SAG 52.96 = DSM 107014 TaxID=1521640 RepID=A0A941JT05_9CHRO|nr:MCE family protein [Gomphosphaeria aponina SAG 52.96 = DSM 107014]
MLRNRLIQEGSVGLFALLGLIVFGGLIVWLRGGFGGKSYEIFVEFTDVSGVTLGVNVTYRGVQVGKVTQIKPSSNGVDLTLEISSPDLIMPREVEITTNRYGLIGETSVDILPKVSLSSDALSMSPISPECDSNIIICAEDRIVGELGLQLVPSLVRLANLYGDQQFFDNLNNAAKGLSLAAKEIVELSQELTLLSSTVRQEIPALSENASSLTKAVTETSNQVTTLSRNLDNLVVENQENITTTFNNLGEVSEEIKSLVINLEAIAQKVDSGLDAADTAQIMQDLEILTANLRSLSETISSPTNLVVLQETLDSARATFANAKKITADLDELTGDPVFRNNFRNLVNGLNNLVSSTDDLDTLSSSNNISFGILPAPPPELIFSQAHISLFQPSGTFIDSQRIVK